MNLRSLMSNKNRSPSSWREGDGNPFAAFQRDMRQLMEEFFGDDSRSGKRAVSPAIDIREEGNKLEICADLPGVDEKDIQLTLEEDRLIIRGEKKSEQDQRQGDYYISERSYGSFMRTVPLPYAVDPAKVEARFTDGVLRITMEKPAESAQNKVRIPINRKGSSYGAAMPDPGTTGHAASGPSVMEDQSTLAGSGPSQSTTGSDPSDQFIPDPAMQRPVPPGSSGASTKGMGGTSHG